MSKLFPAHVREALLALSPTAPIASSAVKPRTRKILIHEGLADPIEIAEIGHLRLTRLGGAVRELVEEIRAHERTFQRMREGVIGETLAPRTGTASHLVVNSGSPLPAHIQSRGSTCGSTNHDSFSAFLADLNARGLNGWSMVAENGRNVPRNGGPGQPPSHSQPAPKEEDHEDR